MKSGIAAIALVTSVFGWVGWEWWKHDPPPKVIERPELSRIHFRYEMMFLEAMGVFGFTRMMGFEHEFPSMPFFIHGTNEHWVVHRGSLLGLAEHDEPVVMSHYGYSMTSREKKEPRFGGGHLHPSRPPGKEQTGWRSYDAEYKREQREDGSVLERGLTHFEEKALKRMLKKRDETGPWVARDEEGSNRYLMMAAIRARQECLKCHGDYELEEPLGAFVYELEKLSKEESLHLDKHSW